MARFLRGSFLGPPMIVRLFPRRFFHGPMVVNGMRVPLDMMDSKRKRKYIGNDMFIQLFYTLYLIYMEKKVKQMFMEMICLYNWFTYCI